MKRVSKRRADSGTPLVISNSKCLIQIVPDGKDQFPWRLNPIVKLVSGNENQRVLEALSDQNETLMSYDTMPASGFKLRRSENAPVCERAEGREAVVEGE